MVIVKQGCGLRTITQSVGFNCVQIKKHFKQRVNQEQML
ncbi:putative membrane protein [Enterobacter sp. OLF]|nr:putative membrane protein [Enterobacter sp. OLF]